MNIFYIITLQISYLKSCKLINYLKMNEQNHFVFTRYLYEKEEVEKSLLFSILNKNIDESAFWACELFYSGFLEYLIGLFWKIYYDFYATLNPSFEKILLKIIEKKLLIEKKEKYIIDIITYFIKIPFNIDIFILEQISKTNIEKDYLNKLTEFKLFKKTYHEWLETSDYFNLTLYILSDCMDKELDDIMDFTISYFITIIGELDKDTILKQVKNVHVKNKCSKKKIILTKIIGLFSIKNNLDLGKKIKTILLKDEENGNTKFATVNHEFNDGRSFAYTILKHECKFGIDTNNNLSLFHLKRDKKDIKDAYLYNWLYFASFSPIWKERIMKFKGEIINDKQVIEFPDDDYLEMFYEKYGYEPDEQNVEVQNKSIQKIQNTKTWSSFYENNNKNCLIDLDLYYLSDITKIYY